jgi:hypothetical protein
VNGDSLVVNVELAILGLDGTLESAVHLAGRMSIRSGLH